jgi:hypothetical protein
VIRGTPPRFQNAIRHEPGVRDRSARSATRKRVNNVMKPTTRSTVPTMVPCSCRFAATAWARC